MDNSKENVSVNPKYRDGVFQLLFGSYQYREYTLSLYNALAGTDYTDPNEIEFTTISGALFVSRINDVSLLIHNTEDLWEQQSTYNPNMPLRGLFYFSELYGKYVNEHGCDLYGSKLIRLPKPEYYVFYNGTTEMGARTKLRLSDSFLEPCKDGSFEWTATVINLNHSDNREFLDKCEALSGYTELCERIRKYSRTCDTTVQAVDTAIKECIENGILVDFLKENLAEVKRMSVLELDVELHERALKEEGRQLGLEDGRRLGLEDGRRLGLEAGRMEQARETAYKMADRNIPLETISELVNVSAGTVKEWLDQRLVTA